MGHGVEADDCIRTCGSVIVHDKCYMIKGSDFLIVKMPYENRADLRTTRDEVTHACETVTREMERINKELNHE